ncbi:MAG: hypothetical protein QM689_05590 [Oscillospiraceae bacterium]
MKTMSTPPGRINPIFTRKWASQRIHFKQISLNEKKSDLLFAKYYLKGGLEEVTADTVKQYVADNYIRFEYLSFPKTSADKGAAAKADAEKYKKMFTDDKKTFDEVIEAYNKDQKTSATGTGTDSTSDSTTDSSAAATDSTVDSSTAATDSTSATDSSTAATDSTSATDSSTAATGSSGDESTVSTKEPSEADDYPNEIMMKKDTDTYGTEITALFKYIDSTMKNNTIDIYEDDSTVYLVYKADVTGRDQYPVENYDNLVTEMKTTEFTGKIDAWVAALTVSDNTDALNRYTAEELFERQNDYYEDSAKAAQ